MDKNSKVTSSKPSRELENVKLICVDTLETSHITERQPSMTNKTCKTLNFNLPHCIIVHVCCPSQREMYLLCVVLVLNSEQKSMSLIRYDYQYIIVPYDNVFDSLFWSFFFRFSRKFKLCKRLNKVYKIISKQ